MERGAATVVFASGMAVVAATLGVTLKAGAFIDPQTKGVM